MTRITPTLQDTAMEAAGDFKTCSSPTNLPDPTSQLNKLGEQGWEVVGVYTEIKTSFPNFGDHQYHTGVKTNTKTSQVTFVLKRQKR